MNKLICSGLFSALLVTLLFLPVQGIAQSRMSKGIQTGGSSISSAVPELADLESDILDTVSLQDNILDCALQGRFYDPSSDSCRTTDPIGVEFTNTGATQVRVQRPDGTFQTYNLDGAAGTATILAADPDAGDDSEPDTAGTAGKCKAYPSTYASQPASNTATGCTTGTYAELADTSTKWRWKCNSPDTGANTICGANKEEESAESPTCGSATSVRTASAPSSNLCGVGSASAVTSKTSAQYSSQTYWAWTCTEGANTANCSAPKPAWWNANPRLYYTCSNGSPLVWPSSMGKPSGCTGSYASSKGYSTRATTPDSPNWGSVGNPTVSSCTTLNQKGYIYDSYTDTYGNRIEKLQLVTCRTSNP